jgi:ketosteroid isomerase-like protein
LAVIEYGLVSERAKELEGLAVKAADALNRGDYDTYLSVLDPDVEFTSLIAEAEGEVFRGHEGGRRWWETVRGAFDEVHWEFQSVEVLGHDEALGRVRISGVLGGVRVEQTMWQAMRFRGSRASWWRFYRTEDEARAALGPDAPSAQQPTPEER